ncbi:DUF4333 domain-containing protein [Mycobacterium vicinigordonae]|uniref:DUF4333 domain-containing protein n=1 Tax=Mycobacterium vicinigordonae TaxID=1719132 RepID=A0A7D6E8C0_9MYCO|nr:DUF4333 domain-containing protein [Mycobacterium vicinigordonae]QLL09023.1 DUF4333 domain-containing protein [Mycobacterium vicinigordonae]
MRRMVRTFMVSGAAVGLLASVGACSCSIGSKSASAVSKKDVEGQISAKMTDANGSKPSSVSCPSDLPAKVGAQTDCVMTVKDEKYNVNVTVTSIDGSNVKFDMVETVDKDEVAHIISDKLYQQVGDRPESVTCPENLKGSVGATMRCELKDNAKTYGISVNVTSVVGGQVNFDFQVDDHAE